MGGEPLGGPARIIPCMIGSMIRLFVGVFFAFHAAGAEFVLPALPEASALPKSPAECRLVIPVT